MKIGKQIEIESLNLKLLSEKVEIAENQLKLGSDDLHFRLSHFRKRIADKDKYDQFFFGAKMADIKKRIDDQINEVILHDAQKELPVTYQKKDPWLKKIYRKIVSTTHPDKFVNFPVENLKQKYLEIYRRAVLAWDASEDDQILVCAYESDIRINDAKALPILQQGNFKKSNRLKEIEKLLAYQWYHVPEIERSKTLENYLKNLGYEFTSEEVEKVVHLPRKRKVGVKPKKIKRLKKKNN